MRFPEKFPVVLRFSLGNGLAVLENLGIHAAFGIGHFYRLAAFVGRVGNSEGSQKAVAEKTGIKQAVLSAIINRGSQVRSDTLKSILEAYPSLNARWLITGQGDMWDGPPPAGLEGVKAPASPAGAVQPTANPEAGGSGPRAESAGSGGVQAAGAGGIGGEGRG